MTWLRIDYRHYRTGGPVSIATQVATISVLNVFFRNTLAWIDHVLIVFGVTTYPARSAIRYTMAGASVIVTSSRRSVTNAGPCPTR